MKPDRDDDKISCVVVKRAVNVFDICCRDLSFHPESGTLPEGHTLLEGEKSRSVSQLVASAGKWRQRSDVAPRVIVPGDVVMDLARGDSIFLLPRPRAIRRSDLVSFRYSRLRRFQSSVCLSLRLLALAAKYSKDACGARGEALLLPNQLLETTLSLSMA